MRFASKYMVIPYVKPIEKPLNSKVLELDAEMTSILADSTLNLDEKVIKYSQTLSKFEAIYDPNSHGVPSILTDIAGQVQVIAEKVLETIPSFVKPEETVKAENNVKNDPTDFISSIKKFNPRPESNIVVAPAFSAPIPSASMNTDEFDRKISKRISKPVIKYDAATGKGLWLSKNFFS